MKNHSHDPKIEKVAVASENIENANLQKLRTVFPNFVKDGVIDFDALQAFLKTEGILAGDEKYGLSWAGKSNAFRAIRRQATGTLVPQEEESKDWNKTENLFIEGDNLEVLKLLQKKYRGAIKMIYIDPPYNTGKDFVYKDNFTKGVADYYEQTGQTKGGVKMTALAEKSGRYHSDWLTMIYPRLFLASNLLTDDGVIFVSIDDNEVHNLRMVLDDIFGEENFITCFVWEKTQHFGRQKVNYYSNADYILCYAKSIRTNEKDSIKELLVEKINKELEDAPLYNASNSIATLVFPAGSVKFNIDDGEYLKTADEKYELLEKVVVKNDYNVNELKLRFRSRWSQNSIDEEYGKGTTFWIKSKNFAIRTIYHEEKSANNSSKQILFTNRNNSLCVFDRFQNKIGTSEEGSGEVKELFDNIAIFDYPKPVSLIGYLISLLFNYKDNSYDNEGIILDFFAGSGTTADAVMKTNAEDGGNRKWICVQLPEELDEKNGKTDEEMTSIRKRIAFLQSINKPTNIAEICKERIRRAGTKIGKGNVGFKSFKLQKSNYRQWNVLTVEDNEEVLKKQIKLFADKPLVDGYDEKTVVFEVLLKEGFDLNAKVEQVRVGSLQLWKIIETDKRLFITFALKVTQEQVGALALTDQDMFVCLDSALDDTTKVNLIRNVKVKVI